MSVKSTTMSTCVPFVNDYADTRFAKSFLPVYMGPLGRVFNLKEGVEKSSDTFPLSVS